MVSTLWKNIYIYRKTESQMYSHGSWIAISFRRKCLPIKHIALVKVVRNWVLILSSACVAMTPEATRWQSAGTVFLIHKTSKQEFVTHSKAAIIETLDSSICFHCARCRDWMEELRCIFGGSWKGRRQDIKSCIFKEKLFVDTTPNLHVTPKLPQTILIIAFSNYSCSIHPPTHKLAQIYKYITLI